MLDRANRTFICSVLFADIVEYSRKPVAEQIKLKDRFNSIISKAIRDIALNDRIILDTGDGAAISFLGDPEDALFVAISLREAIGNQNEGDSPQLQARLGINLGPVKLVKDINGQPNIIGDGINVAQRVMGFAQPGQVLVSRSYYEVVSCMSQEYAQLFHYEGSRTDKHIREHEVYAVGHPSSDLWTNAAASGKHKTVAVAESAAVPSGASGGAAEPGLPPVKQWNKKLAIGVPLGVAAVLVFAGVLRSYKDQPKAPQAAAPVVTGQAAQPPAAPQIPKPAAEPKTAPEVSEQPAKPRSPKPPAPPAAAASVGLAIAPWGEVYVDGKLQGVSPPLNVIEVSPGKHTIEIKNTTFPTYTETIDAQPRQRLRIRHKFP